MLVSTLMAALDPRRESPLERTAGMETSDPASRGTRFADLVDSFMGAGLRQTDAVLKVFAEMAGDELLHKRITRAVAERRRPLPGWLLRLDQVRPYRAVFMTHVLGDGDNIVVGFKLPSNREAALLVYIDHNMGTVVKDAFPVPGTLEPILKAWTGAAELADYNIRDIPLAEARARITPAIELGTMTTPPFESDSWPGCRALLEWIVSMMPEGGEGYSRPEWSDQQLDDLADDFFASDYGSALQDDDHESLLHSILWFGTDHGPGDPMRWSPTAVEILLVDWMPRTIMAAPDYLAKTPELLRAFVRYSHATRGIPGNLTQETLAGIDTYEPKFNELIGVCGQPGLGGDVTQRRLMAQMLSGMAGLAGYSTPGGAAAFDDDDDDDWDDDDAVIKTVLKPFAREVGGFDALAELSADPLPDEAFVWAGIPEDIHARVAEVLELTDGCCDALFDVEFRTAARRFLAQVARANPDIFRRKGASPPAAGAVCWVIGKTNDSFKTVNVFGGPSTGSQVKDIAVHFGIKSAVSQRAQPMLRAVVPGRWTGEPIVGDPRLLVAAKRIALIDIRDRILALLPDTD